jgi:hypothetical protein
MKYWQLSVKTLLLLCLAFGSWGGFLVSYATFSGKDPCPEIFTVHVCYLVFSGYLSMLFTQVLPAGSNRNKIFTIAWILVFGFAIFGVVAELLVGDICPKNNVGMPLCYISLLLALCVMTLFQLLIKLEHNNANIN